MQPVRFYGDVPRPLRIIYPYYDREFPISPMTAFATVYTEEGFVIGADGRSYLDENKYNHDPSDRDVQKVFPMVLSQGVLAYAARGNVITEDGGFDVNTAIRHWIDEAKTYDEFHELLDALAEHLADYVKCLLVSGLGGCYPILFINISGYFKGNPYHAQIEFLEFPVVPYQIYDLWVEHAIPGRVRPAASSVIDGLVSRHDPRVCKPPTRESNLYDATAFITDYLNLCTSDLGRALDPSCIEFGGTVHVAEVTESEFRWHLPPPSYLQ